MSERLVLQHLPIMARVIIFGTLVSTFVVFTACSECQPSLCTDHVEFKFVGTGPDAGLLSIELPYTVKLEIHDSDGEVIRHEFSAGVDEFEPADIEFDRETSIGYFSMRLGQPRNRDAIADTVYLEIETDDWYGAQTFDLDYVETGECCSVASDVMYFQPKRDLP